MKTLWIDDNFFSVHDLVEFLIDLKFQVDKCETIKDSISKLSTNTYDVVILDLMMKDDEKLFDEMSIRGGYETGKAFARYIRENWPGVKIIGCSGTRDVSIKTWFIDNYDGYIDKSERLSSERLNQVIQDAVKGINTIRTFIVHGHDEVLLAELKDYLSRVLKLPLPIVLREQPSLGRTIIEKFEEYSDHVDLCFVLLTPDDKIVHPKEEIRRARQNVVFELGYFLAKLSRKSGKVILLYKGDLDLPSDISGLIYIKIEENIKAISDDIRSELEGIFPKFR